MTLDMIIAQIMTENPGMSQKEAERMAIARVYARGRSFGKSNEELSKQLGYSVRGLQDLRNRYIPDWREKYPIKAKNNEDNKKIEKTIQNDVISEALANHADRMKATYALPPAQDDPVYLTYVQDHNIDINIQDYERAAYIKYLTDNFENLGMDYAMARSNAEAMANDYKKLSKWVLENRKPSQAKQVEDVQNKEYNEHEKRAYAESYILFKKNGFSNEQIAEKLDVKPEIIEQWLADEKFKEDVNSRLIKAEKEEAEKQATKKPEISSDLDASDKEKLQQAVANANLKLPVVNQNEKGDNSKDDDIPKAIVLYDGQTNRAEDVVKPGKLEKLKNLVKKHKKAVIIGGLLLVGAAIATAHAIITGDTSSVSTVNDVNFVDIVNNTISDNLSNIDSQVTNGMHNQELEALKQASALSAPVDSLQAAANSMDPNMIDTASLPDLSAVDHNVSTNAYDAVAGQNSVTTTNTGVPTVGFDTAANQYVPLENLTNYTPEDLANNVAVLEGTEDLAQKLHGITDQVQINDILQNNNVDTIAWHDIPDIPSGKTL